MPLQSPSSGLSDFDPNEGNRSGTESEFARAGPGPVPREVKARAAAKDSSKQQPARRAHPEVVAMPMTPAGPMPLPNQQQQAIASASGKASTPGSTSRAPKAAAGGKKKAGINKPTIVQDEDEDMLDATQHPVVPAFQQQHKKTKVS